MLAPIAVFGRNVVAESRRFSREKIDMSGARSCIRSVASVRACAAICLGAARLPFRSRLRARGPEGIADIAERVIDAVVNISTSQTVNAKGGPNSGAGARCRSAAGLALRGVLRRVLQGPPGGRANPKGGELQPRDQFARFGLHHRSRGHRRDQQSRHRRRRRDHGHPQRRHQDARPSWSAATRRPISRCSRSSRRRSRCRRGEVRRFATSCGSANG